MKLLPILQIFPFWDKLLALIVVTGFASAVYGAHPLVKDGRINATSFVFDETSVLDLEGQWEFYWQSLLNPQDFEKVATPVPEFIKVPGSWSTVANYPDKGYATYRAIITIPKVEQMSIDVNGVWAASKVFVDGKEMLELGQVGDRDDPSVYFPKIRDKIYTFTPKHRTFEVIIQASNYEIFLAGIATKSPSLGKPEATRNWRLIDGVEAFFIVGSMIIMGLYHLVLWAIRRKDKSPFYFSFVCFTVGLYMALNRGGSPAIHILFPSLDYSLYIKLFNLWVISAVFFLFYFQSLFPRYMSIRWPKYFAYFVGVVCAFIIVNRPRDFIWTVPILQLATLVAYGYIFLVLVRVTRAREESSIMLMIGVLINTSAATHDALMTMSLFKSIALGGYGALAFMFIQSMLLARRFSNAFTTVEQSSEEIKKLSYELRVERDHVIELNENLEEMVEEKTKDIRSIMTHIEIGIFTIMKDYKIHKDYSQHLHTLFQTDELEGCDGLKILFFNSNLSSDDIDQAVNIISCSIGEPSLSWQANSASLPSEIQRQRNDGSWCVLDITWNPIISNDDIVEKVLISVRDVTELRLLALEANSRQEELEIIGELLSVPLARLRQFFQNCQYFIAENRKLIHSKSIKIRSLDVLKVLYINMHNMKGSARALHFKKMTAILHEIEQYYAVLQKNADADWNLEKMKRDIDEAESIVERYAQLNEYRLGRSAEDEEMVTLPKNLALSWYDYMKDNQRPSVQDKQLVQFIHNKIYTPLNSIINELSESLPALARDLGKELPVVEYRGCEDLYLSSTGSELLKRVFIHILRNTMDHGIESANERIEAGKSKCGVIRFQTVKKDDSYELTYQDDGRGLDIKKIKEAAARDGIIRLDEDLSALATANLIFQSGLSTANSISDVSGRGVGMDAIRSYLHEAGAEIAIDLHEDVNENKEFIAFSFIINLPYKLFADPIQHDIAA